MTDKIQTLIDAKIVSGGQSLGDERPDINQGIRELMQEHAASEVDRLLDCLAEHLMHDFISMGTLNCHDGRGDYFYWNHGDDDESDMEGDTKDSLLEYIGFSGGEG